jgi:sigma-B regulation protein RsbU (phosphoserine phosphatase)
MKPHRQAEGVHTMHCMEIFGGTGIREEVVSTPGLEGWIYCKPFESATHGGDVHYVSLCGGGVITRLIVADVSGHGQEVADVARALRAMVRKNINRKSQTRLVQALNRQFAAMAQLRQFATAVVATYLATKRTFSICNAGHPRPFLYRAASGDWSVLDAETGAAVAANLPLGIDDETPYEQFAVTLEPGDLVLLYTDALVEASDASDNLLGEAGLLDLARSLPGSNPREIGPGLLAGVDRHRGGRPSDDDATLVILRHTASGPRRLSVGEKLDVYAKVFGLKTV